MYTAQIVRLNDLATLDEVQEKLQQSLILDEIVDHEDWPENEPLTKRWRSVEAFGTQKSQLVAGTRETVEFLIAEGYNERTKNRRNWFENGESGDLVAKPDRVNVTKFNSVFFKSGTNIYVAPFLPLSANLNTYINDLLPEDIWGSKTKEPFEYRASKDFFYWLLNVFTRGNKIVSHSPDIMIPSWTGFHGTTQDSVHRLSGEGERISAILSTLAFIFMDDPLKSLSISIKYENELIPIQLGQTGYFTLPDYEYSGAFANAYNGTARHVLLTILVYSKVLPSLIEIYNQAILNGQWNDQVKEEFRKYIGDQIISRVTQELSL